MHVSFDIRADMWAQPMPLELYLRSQVDVTTGQTQLIKVSLVPRGGEDD